MFCLNLKSNQNNEDIATLFPRTTPTCSLNNKTKLVIVALRDFIANCANQTFLCRALNEKITLLQNKNFCDARWLKIGDDACSNWLSWKREYKDMDIAVAAIYMDSFQTFLSEVTFRIEINQEVSQFLELPSFPQCSHSS